MGWKWPAFDSIERLRALLRLSGAWLPARSASAPAATAASIFGTLLPAEPAAVQVGTRPQVSHLRHVAHLLQTQHLPGTGQLYRVVQLNCHG